MRAGRCSWSRGVLSLPFISPTAEGFTDSQTARLTPRPSTRDGASHRISPTPSRFALHTCPPSHLIPVPLPPHLLPVPHKQLLPTSSPHFAPHTCSLYPPTLPPSYLLPVPRRQLLLLEESVRHDVRVLPPPSTLPPTHLLPVPRRQLLLLVEKSVRNDVRVLPTVAGQLLGGCALLGVHIKDKVPVLSQV